MYRITSEEFPLKHDDLEGFDYNIMDEIVQFDPVTLKISLYSNIPVPMQLVYTHMHGTFAQPGFMQYHIPMTAMTHNIFKVINDWKLKGCEHRGLYLRLEKDETTSLWSKNLVWGPTYSSSEGEVFRQSPFNNHETSVVFLSEYLVPTA